MMGWKGWRTALVGAVGLATLAAAVNEPSPLSIEASQYWEGDDGPWSTFSLRLGTPPQVVRVLVSTAWPNTVAVLNSSCPGGDSSTCANDRGELFAPNSSTTWHERGIFALPAELNYSMTQDTGYWGLDSIQFGLEPNGLTLTNQVLAAMETDDYYLGYLGIDPQTTNWTSNFSVQTPSLFKTLYSEGKIPSFSYSYTAGASYRLKQVVGSMVFGGYDASRVTPNNLTIQFADVATADLVVAITAITASTGDDSHDLLDGPGVLALVDSTTPYYVLPYDVCLAFEQAFGLEWNPQAGHNGMYTLTSQQHDTLVSLNPNVTFTLSDDLTPGTTTNIVLPYAAFDLIASPPLVNATTHYFPLLRAANNSQVTLGRAFLQEAMLITDYERGNFSIYQCVWNAEATENLITIQPSGYVPPPAAASSSSALKLGLGLGIGLGAPLLVLLSLLLFAYLRRRWPFADRVQEPRGRADPELDSKAVRAEVDSRSLSSTKRLYHEVDTEARTELGNSQTSTRRQSRHSYRNSHVAPELVPTVPDVPAPPYRELPGSEPARELSGEDVVERSRSLGSTVGATPTDARSIASGRITIAGSTHAGDTRSIVSGGGVTITGSTRARDTRSIAGSVVSRERPAESPGALGGSRMLMELAGSPVSSVYYKSRTPPLPPNPVPRARQSVHSTRSSRSLRSVHSELPPLPPSARASPAPRSPRSPRSQYFEAPPPMPQSYALTPVSPQTPISRFSPAAVAAAAAGANSPLSPNSPSAAASPFVGVGPLPGRARDAPPSPGNFF